MSEQPNKMQIVEQIGIAESALAQAESRMRDAERELQSAKGNRTAGAAALLIGIIAGLFVSIWIGGFLAIIGLLTLVTAIGRESSAESRLKEYESIVASKRGLLAQLRALLAVM